MASLAAGNHVGDALTVLWTDGPQTRVAYGTVAADVPFSVELENESCPDAGSEVRLVRDQGERWVAGSATVSFCDDGFLVLRDIIWEEPSQRVHERTFVEWPTTLRILDDLGTRQSYQIGMTTDVSLGGAAILVEDSPEVGSLIEVSARPRGAAPMRAVGVVVRRKEQSIGLAFLYLWGATFTEAASEQQYRRAA